MRLGVASNNGKKSHYAVISPGVGFGACAKYKGSERSARTGMEYGAIRNSSKVTCMITCSIT